jgi:hypothetical protein
VSRGVGVEVGFSNLSLVLGEGFGMRAIAFCQSTKVRVLEFKYLDPGLVSSF